MAAIMVILECLTNLHAGNGDVNYNIIDNEVEKDPVTGYPVINASGVKGALRKHFKNAKLEETWFGKDAQGKLKFLGANMLAIPLRASKGKDAFYRVSTDLMIQKYNEFCDIFLDGHEKISGWVDENRNSDKKAVESFKLDKKTTFQGTTVYDIYRIGADDLRNIELPVIARNKLEDGISDNLWYEEVVPHESIFYFPVFVENNEDDINLLKEFVKALNDSRVIQFGGNASIGYGLCKVTVKEVTADE